MRPDETIAENILRIRIPKRLLKLNARVLDRMRQSIDRQRRQQRRPLRAKKRYW